MEVTWEKLSTKFKVPLFVKQAEHAKPSISTSKPKKEASPVCSAKVSEPVPTSLYPLVPSRPIAFDLSMSIQAVRSSEKRACRTQIVSFDFGRALSS